LRSQAAKSRAAPRRTVCRPRWCASAVRESRDLATTNWIGTRPAAALAASVKRRLRSEPLARGAW